jgi:hypothetical protein
MERIAGHIAGLFVYPVKGCRGISLDAAELRERGLSHDRRWMIVDASGRFRSQRELPALARVVPAIKGDRLCLAFDGQRVELAVHDSGEPMRVTVWRDEIVAVRPSPQVDAALSAWLGRPLHLVRFPDAARRPCDPTYAPPGAHVAFSDGFPLLVTSEASLAELNDAMLERGGEALPMARFRPSLVLGGVPARAEDRRRRIELGGGAALELVKPCDRCIVTTTDQLTGERCGDEPLATLRRIRRNPATGGMWFGQNAVPVLPHAPVTLRVGDACVLVGSPVDQVARRAAARLSASS